ncbi:MAG: SAM-dependent chlorinase/fluorinase [Deltaproteobacteria bacterium]|nr:SAM-dependent chlorinase/fluorinase [Deltaproteobacteria bacterium]
MPPPDRPPFLASGVITLTTDFGHRGPFVGTMKGVMLGRFPGAQIIDLTHEIVVHWPAEAGFWLERSFRYFPKGTVHVAVVDPGVGTQREIILVVHEGHAFFAPDNGLLAPLFSKSHLAYRLDVGRFDRLGLSNPSVTFHGRDIFAPLAADLAARAIRPEDLGPHVEEVVPSWVDDPVATETRLSGVVIAVDHFGNLITNIEAELLARFSDPVVQAGSISAQLRRTYGDVRPGEYLALVNSFGVLEVARAEQSAADGLGLSRGAPISVEERRRG